MRLRLTLGLVLAGCLSSGAASAASPAGLWWTQDHDGVIAIAPCAEGLCGRIVGQAEPVGKDGRRPVDSHGVPQCGLRFLRGTPTADGRFGGFVTDPETGRDWHCTFWVGASGRMHLRGYGMVPLFGETQTWAPFYGSVTADCTITDRGG